MQRLEVTGAVRLVYRSLGVKGLRTIILQKAAAPKTKAADCYEIFQPVYPNIRGHIFMYFEYHVL
jgi:hypothetical protein